MKNIWKLFVFIAVFCSGAALFGQFVNGISPAGQAQIQNQVPGAAPAPTVNEHNYRAFESKTSENLVDRLFDVNKDSFDLENGSYNWKGKTFNIGNTRVVRARFEKYLSTPVPEQSYKDYKRILDEITSALSASNDNLDDDVIRYEWKRLFDAAEYDIDGNFCMLIANNVYATWRMRSEYDIFRGKENSMELFKKSEESKLIGRMMTASEVRQPYRRGAGVKDPKLTRNSEQNIEHAVQDVAKAAADLTAATAEKELTGIQSVLRYQSQTISFLLGRKFVHAQIACSFYRHLFRGRAQELAVGSKEMKDLFPVSDFVPTNDSLENIALEALNDVRGGMAAVEALYDSNQRYNALMRLMETFVLGEYCLEVQMFPFEKKAVLLKIYRELSTLQKLADNKDYGAIEESVAEMDKLCSDFPSAEILSGVKTAQRVSNMHLMAARQAAAAGNAEEVQRNVAEAAKVWPLNPQIATLNDEIIGMATGATKYTEKFDSLYNSGSYREIVGEAAEYGLVFAKDPQRAGKLKEIVSKIGQIDMLISQAAEFVAQKNPYYAWELLESAKKIEPEDPSLARAMSNLAPHVADYVKLLSSAANAEKNGNWAEALNLYLAAQKILPASATCRQGIERTAPLYNK